MTNQEIAYYERLQKQSLEASSRLSRQEKLARDGAFNASTCITSLEGWQFNICWDAAREYYLSPAGLMLSKKLFDSTDKFVPEED